MSHQAAIILCLAVVDAILIAALHRILRSTPPMDARALAAGRFGLFAFACQAVFSYEGAILILQLATIAIIGVLSHLQHLGKLSKAAVVASR